MPSFYEFFAGGGMARIGLNNWTCLFANDLDGKKALSYQANFPHDGILEVGDIAELRASDMQEIADLAWASFPCQDLSLAGKGKGLAGDRSGTFHTFFKLMAGLEAIGRGPRMICVENVTGSLTSNNGADFEAICRTFHEHGYAFGSVVIDASLFVPQSRRRLFVIGIKMGMKIAPELLAPEGSVPFHAARLRRAVASLPSYLQKRHLWWNMALPKTRTKGFSDLIEDNPTSVEWHTQQQSAALLSMMTPVNLAKVHAAKMARRKMVGTLYKRTRIENGERQQRAEVRFDDIAGCLRTPGGGSSRQTIIVVKDDKVRTRLISSRETARLMGLPDSYRLPIRYNDAYHLTGDGVVVDVVKFLKNRLFEPLLGSSQVEKAIDYKAADG